MSQVTTFDIGRKRVGVCTYCPDDALGFATEQFLLEKIQSLIGSVSEDEVRAWMFNKNPTAAKQVFDVLDSGGTLPKLQKWYIEPANAEQDLAIASYMRK